MRKIQIGDGIKLSYGNTIKKHDNICFYCDRSINNNNRTKDHMYPESRGGILSNDNKVFCCQECNSNKANRTPEEWLKAVEEILLELRNPRVEYPKDKSEAARILRKTIEKAVSLKSGYYFRIKINLIKITTQHDTR